MSRYRAVTIAAAWLLLLGCSSGRRSETASSQGGFGSEPVVNPVADPEAQSSPVADRRGGSPDPEMAAACEMACAAKVTYREEELALQPAARLGDLTRCPVSGVVFQVRKNSARYASGTETWFTCCGTCAGKLKADPARFLGS